MQLVSPPLGPYFHQRRAQGGGPLAVPGGPPAWKIVQNICRSCWTFFGLSPQHAAIPLIHFPINPRYHSTRYFVCKEFQPNGGHDATMSILYSRLSTQYVDYYLRYRNEHIQHVECLGLICPLNCKSADVAISEAPSISINSMTHLPKLWCKRYAAHIPCRVLRWIYNSNEGY